MPTLIYTRTHSLCVFTFSTSALLLNFTYPFHLIFFLFDFTFLSFPPYLYFPTSNNGSQLSVLNLESMEFYSGRPTCVFVWVSVSWSSGHVNRISLFHAQSHPAITDPWGCMEGVWLHTERGQHRLEDIRPDEGVHFCSTCARRWLPCV